MAGGRGSSGGQNRKSLEALMQSGGFRRDRHAVLLHLRTPSPQLAALLTEIFGEYWTLARDAKAEVARWAALEAQHPTIPKYSTQRLQWARHYVSVLDQLVRRAAEWHPPQEIDAFTAFQQQRRHARPDDDVA